MKVKLVSFILGLSLGATVNVILRKVKEKMMIKDMTEVDVSCPILDKYGNQISILCFNNRYDLFLSESSESIDLDAVVRVSLYKGDIHRFISVGDIPVVNGWNKNTNQIEKVVQVNLYNISDTSVSFGYKNKQYYVLLDIVNEEGVTLNFNPVEDILIAESEYVFDILRIGNIKVLDWEEVNEGC